MAGFFVLALFYVSSLQAEDIPLQEQLEDVKAKIEEEKAINAELRAQLATRETRVSELKLQLSEIEEEIAALKRKHNIQ